MLACWPSSRPFPVLGAVHPPARPFAARLKRLPGCTHPCPSLVLPALVMPALALPRSCPALPLRRRPPTSVQHMASTSVGDDMVVLSERASALFRRTAAAEQLVARLRESDGGAPHVPALTAEIQRAIADLAHDEAVRRLLHRACRTAPVAPRSAWGGALTLARAPSHPLHPRSLAPTAPRQALRRSADEQDRELVKTILREKLQRQAELREQ